MRLAINRTVAPQMTLAEFITLAVGAGVEGVEIRADVEGREIADGTPPAEVKARLDDAGLAVASLNALQRVNDWSAEREHEAVALVRAAAALGAPGLVLCPRHDGTDGWDEATRAAKLRDGLAALAPILRDHGVTGYLEPLGMRGSTLWRQAEAVAGVEAVDGWDAYAICHDTFQAFRAGDDTGDPARIGLVHVSGILRVDLTPGDLTEPDRGLVGEVDRVGNLDRLRALKAAGYAGFVSIEPFDPGVQADPALPDRLRESVARLRGLTG